MNVSIIINNRSFSSEAYAYSNFLNKKGIKTSLCFKNDINNNSGIVIDLMGFRPKKKFDLYYIHDYSSLSTPPYATIKNFIKKQFNFKPNKRIFNCENIKKGFNFNDNIPSVIRDTGVDDIFYKKINSNIEFDLIYSGTSQGRRGLINCMTNLSKKGFKIAVVGKFSQSDIDIMKKQSINYLGEFKRYDLPEIYQKSHAGLNFTPNIYPYNIQNSTKIKEYCASNLKIISNKYNWVKNFEKNEKGSFLWYHNNLSLEEFHKFKFITPLIDHLKWNNILKNISFDKFVKNF